MKENGVQTEKCCWDHNQISHDLSAWWSSDRVSNHPLLPLGPMFQCSIQPLKPPAQEQMEATCSKYLAHSSSQVSHMVWCGLESIIEKSRLGTKEASGLFKELPLSATCASFVGHVADPDSLWISAQTSTRDGSQNTLLSLSTMLNNRTSRKITTINIPFTEYVNIRKGRK